MEYVWRCQALGMGWCRARANFWLNFKSSGSLLEILGSIRCKGPISRKRRILGLVPGGALRQSTGGRNIGPLLSPPPGSNQRGAARTLAPPAVTARHSRGMASLDIFTPSTMFNYTWKVHTNTALHSTAVRTYSLSARG